VSAPPTSPFFTPTAHGLGPGALRSRVAGVLHSSNCNCTGYSRPAVLTLDGPNSAIEVPSRPGGVGVRARLARWEWQFEREVGACRHSRVSGGWWGYVRGR
jgi:hypothetical protein